MEGRDQRPSIILLALRLVNRVWIQNGAEKVVTGVDFDCVAGVDERVNSSF